MIKRFFSLFFISLLSVLLGVFLLRTTDYGLRTAYAADASLFLSPPAGSGIIGEEFPVRVFLSTGGATVNAVEGKIIFDPDALEVKSVTVEDSALPSWTSAPTFDNASGTISWSGVAASGVSGDRVPVLTIFLTAHRVEESSVRFATGAAVLSADGSGTNILTAMNGGVYAGVPKETLPISVDDTKNSAVNLSSSDAAGNGEIGEVLGVATGTAEVTSLTHPDPEGWYATTTVQFSWTNSDSIIAVRTGLDHSPKTLPLREYRPPITEKTVDNVDEGVWYFHLTKEYGDGKTATLHRKLGVDVTPPNALDITVLEREDTTDPNVAFMVMATDTLSGIERFTFTIDEGVPTDWRDDGSHRYAPGSIPSGEHVLHAIAYDRAGNTVKKDVSITVAALPPPEITLSDPAPQEGKPIAFSGKTLPNVSVHIALLRSGETQPIIEEVRSDASGVYTHLSSVMVAPGVYEYWAEVEHLSGAKSVSSARQSVTVSPTVIGLLKRHPLLPVAIFAFAVLVAVSWWIVRRLRQSSVGRVDRYEVLTSTRVGVATERGIASISAHSRPQVSGGVIRLGPARK